MRYVIRPLDRWTDPETTNRKSGATFKANWNDTLRLLRTEVEHLGAESIVVQVVTDEADLRQDGMLRSRANVRHPGAVVSLDAKLGPLRFVCDTFEARYYGDLESWQANVRAIALGMEALRKVDRYGITNRNEQYTGWLAIEAGGGVTTVEEARQLLDSYGGQAAALKATHPDHGGDRAAFDRVQQARRVLAAAGGAR